jgi:hypothetical protein
MPLLSKSLIFRCYITPVPSMSLLQFSGAIVTATIKSESQRHCTDFELFQTRGWRTLAASATAPEVICLLSTPSIYRDVGRLVSFPLHIHVHTIHQHIGSLNLFLQLCCSFVLSILHRLWSVASLSLRLFHCRCRSIQLQDERPRSFPAVTLSISTY